MRRPLGCTGRRRRACARAPLRAEALEPRALLAFAPLGPAFPVNPVGAGDQVFPAVASDADGDFVVAWTSENPAAQVMARRYNAQGVPQGSDFRVDTTGGATRGGVAIAADADGDFVVVWSTNKPNLGYGIYGQRFTAAGAARGGEFRVNTSVGNFRQFPSVALDADGDMVVAWSRYSGPGIAEILAQRYDADGIPRGAEMVVAAAPNERNLDPSVAMDADGDFVVTWESRLPSFNIFAQRYDAAGVPQGARIPVDLSIGSKEGAWVSADADGDFVIAWSLRKPPSNIDVYIRRFNAQGVAQTGEVLVNAAAEFERFGTAVALDADGDFTVTWNSYHQDGALAGVYARHFNAAAAPQGNEFVVPTVTAGPQGGQMIASDADGDTVIVWHSHGQDGDQHGIFAQRYDETTDAAGPVVTDVLAAGNRVTTNERLVSIVPQLTVNFSENLSTAGGATGANSATNPANWALTRNGVAVPAVQSVGFGFDAASNKYQAVLTLTSPLGNGACTLTAKQNLRDVAGNPLDGNLDGTPGGGDFVLPFLIDVPVRVGPEFRINTYTNQSQFAPSVASDAAGNFVVTWASYEQDGQFEGVFAQRFSAAGVPLGPEFRVNATTASTQTAPVVALDADGDFVVAWWSDVQDGSLGGIYAQRYSAAGAPLGGEFRVNTHTNDDQTAPAIAADAGGNFVVVWQSAGQDGSNAGVYGQRYGADGAARGGEFRVNTTTTGAQFSPAVAADADGDFVVTWGSNVAGGQSTSGIYGQRFAADGTPVGGEFHVNSTPDGGQTAPAVACDGDGDFVIAWSQYAPVAQDIYARRYTAAGVPRGDEFRVNAVDTDGFYTPAVSSDADGDFVVTWVRRFPSDGSPQAVLVRRFDAAGAAQGPEFRAHTYEGEKIYPSIAADADGDFVVAWASNVQDGSSSGVYAQRYAANERPTTLGVPSVTVAEDEADTLLDLRPFFSDSTDAPEGLTLSLVSNDNPALFSSASVNTATGVLTLDYAHDANGEAQLTVRAMDSGGLSVDSTFTVTVNALNDAPVNHVPDPQFPRRGSPVVFGAANGNAITVTDVDAGGERVVVTLQFPRDTRVELKPSGGITILEESRESLRFRGRLDDVNAALDGLIVTPTESAGETILTITTDDGGATGAGGALSDTDAVSIIYNNEPPLLNVRDVTVTEGNAGTTAAVFVVSYKGAPLPGQVVRVHYATADGAATAASGDYLPVSGLLEFAPGETEKSVTVSVNGDLDAEQPETFFLNLSAPQSAMINDAQGVGTIADDDTPPRVTAVFVNGSTWTPAFRAGLAAAGFGETAFGFAVPAGAQQLAPVPWDGIDRVSIRFDRDVVLLRGDLEIRGVATTSYPTTAMTYVAATHTATWTLAGPVRNDKLLLDLNADPGGVRNPAGVRSDGDWTGSAFPSGNASEGGDFRFRLNVLTGDANRDGRVNATDVLDVRRHLRRSATNPGSGAGGYDLFRDPSADGSIGVADEALVRRYLGGTLPAGEPAPNAAPPVAPAVAPARRIAPITRGFFGDRPIQV